MDRNSFHRRLGWAACGFGVLLLAALAAHLRLAGPERERILADAGFATVKRLFYPVRARILDAAGRPLAWTERRFDLVRRGEGELPAELAAAVSAALGPVEEDDPGVLRRDLAVADLMKLEPLLRRSDELAVTPRLVRLYAGPPEVRRIVGEVTVVDGVQRGVSGLEAEHDCDLAGMPGEYRVMIDRRGLWAEGSWQMLSDPIPATDVRTALKLPEEQP